MVYIKEKKHYLSPKGLEQLRQELEVVKQEKMRKIKEEAPGTSDYREASVEYIQYQEGLEAIEKKILYLQNILEHHELIKLPPKGKRSTVYLGAKVLVETDGQVDEFEITGSFEADPLGGKISDQSPVGKALLGQRAGSEVKVKTPILEYAYKILKIHYEKE